LAAAGYAINGRVIEWLHADFTFYSRTIAPVVEELLKAAFLIFLFVRNRIGFMIDAAIVGFAVGAGFAMAENVYIATIAPDANLGVWVIRGFGTAVMHGGATAVFGVMAQSWTDRHDTINPLLYLPGLAVAIALHAVFNFFQATPLLAAVAIILVVPMTLFVVFDKSEHKIHTWLLSDYETHEHLLEQIRSGQFAQSEAGRFILDLARKFDAAVVASMFKYIQLHTELVLLAEKITLARERGESIPAGSNTRDRFRELHALERAIGRTALLTIWPHLHFNRKELWELHELEGRMRHA
jgi:hypothetical protein